MRELKITGYTKHIGRLCAGWFLITDLGLDWRMGAEWFESILVDYEPALNWFNWVYACLEPVDLKKPPGGQQQCLEILQGGIQHDPDATYIKRWIPELSPLPTIIAREPWRLNPEDIQWAPKSSCLRKMPFLWSFHEGTRKRADEKRRKDAAMRPGGVDANAAVAALHGGNKSFACLQVCHGPVSTCIPKWRTLFSACLPSWCEISTPHAFRYGVDYPKPVIQPVSLKHTEEGEERARWARARAKEQRDKELALRAGSSQRSSSNQEAWFFGPWVPSSNQAEAP